MRAATLLSLLPGEDEKDGPGSETRSPYAAGLSRDETRSEHQAAHCSSSSSISVEARARSVRSVSRENGCVIKSIDAPARRERGRAWALGRREEDGAAELQIRRADERIERDDFSLTSASPFLLAASRAGSGAYSHRSYAGAYRPVFEGGKQDKQSERDASVSADKGSIH